jgi:nicotinamide mononucleotide transporter
MQPFIQQFIQDIKNTSLLEFIAVAFGIISVWFSSRENILVYPTGIINTVLFTYIYAFKTGLYADSIVNIYYTIMSIIGWFMWNKVNDKQMHTAITKSNIKEWLLSTAFTMFWFAVLYTLIAYVMPTYLNEKQFTKSTIPFTDSINAALAFTGMWLMNKKKIEHWFFWMAVNTISIPLNASKSLAFTAIQYVIFLILAIIGYISWRKKLLHNEI